MFIMTMIEIIEIQRQLQVEASFSRASDRGTRKLEGERELIEERAKMLLGTKYRKHGIPLSFHCWSIPNSSILTTL